MIYISAIGMLNALGNDSQQIAASLKKGEAPGMQLRHGWLSGDRACWLGRVEGELPAIPAVLSAHNTRNNQLLLAALIQIRPTLDAAIARYGASRVAIVLGTSTSGVDEGDQQICGGQPDYHYQMQELGDPSRFLAHYLQLDGPAYTISTACSSSARAIISGERLIAAGLADVALVGGADSLSRMPINGFDSLESLSERRCAPFSRERDGISIGEGAALMLLTREPQPLALLGAGESSDAWHMSAPHPQGEGAERAMRMALQQANLLPQQVGYINLHGTATPLNDQMEAAVIHRLFGNAVPCSSTKHLTGHTLGAAGVCEAALSALILQNNLPLPAQDFSAAAQDETLPDCGLLLQPQALQRPVIASNSFAFGGNNTCLILGRLDGH
ncbi:beta-ketoacyl-[acyl-carrier-protein] synthase family protein [Pantoea sp. PNT01]|jgi:3-oxoacyl-[acyl-carrier-protein] synthase-1|uniref:Beta-ketoacyl-[acyl-carrier-protein] synthase family protein n=1 Tax=Pantoea eucalypti TaxID=470933 RepID=A0ABY2ZKV9_9GAMM|nr:MULTISPECIES: beta-ketoacyl-[acyl-carrier-protein] synthase family protein [Pantoea]PQL28484.1 beta-ketoacyl-[acyl-carrier-protein] synthase II [Pantoea ananatis]QXG53409.1 beta-ketoacyl-[acyl-carrier-protein] synthase family protein [Pantoea jilinensis]TPD96508.1 beta-ketoacyl-[acyl-carrier-protein] synthase family protein [Pantoea vagans]MBD9550795.1 beta-ketoacyl-[acyl-carrier-protein] synthase family protein [Pantoea sp. PNT01]MCD2356704.1 beta-ketoacyl-[acyl-carrier-protein] synthase f